MRMSENFRKRMGHSCWRFICLKLHCSLDRFRLSSVFWPVLCVFVCACLELYNAYMSHGRGSMHHSVGLANLPKRFDANSCSFHSFVSTEKSTGVLYCLIEHLVRNRSKWGRYNVSDCFFSDPHSFFIVLKLWQNWQLKHDRWLSFC